MIREYIGAAMHKAQYEVLPEDQSFYGHIAECQGVWANATTLEACRDELEEVLEGWILIRLSKNLPIPVLDGIDLAVKEVV